MQQRAQTAASKSAAARHRCFISYHVADLTEVEAFVDAYGSEFIGECLGVTEDDNFVDSKDEEYIKQRIRELHLSTSTVTIVLLGRCTWARRFVDWEISSTLRSDPVNKRSGLLVMPLPSMNNSAILPARVKDNWVEGSPSDSYASYVSYPTSGTQLRGYIQSAFDARTAKADKVKNSRSLMTTNSIC